MKATIEYAKGIPYDEQDDFRRAFARVCGWTKNQARTTPDAVCTMAEVGELFEVLFDRMIGKAETPAAGTAGESKK